MLRHPCAIRPRRITLLALALFLGTTHLSFGQDAKKDVDKLQGTWEIIELVADGEKMAPTFLKRFAFAGNKMIWGVGEQRKSFTFKLDEKTKPKEIDVTSSDGSTKGKERPGIYLLDGDTLQLCLPLDRPAARPTEFVARKDLPHTLMTLKRIKE